MIDRSITLHTASIAELIKTSTAHSTGQSTMKFVASLLVLLMITKPNQSARLGLFRLDPEANTPNHRIAKEFGGSADDDDTKQYVLH